MSESQIKIGECPHSVESKQSEVKRSRSMWRLAVAESADLVMMQEFPLRKGELLMCPIGVGG
jgi:hypothetical protein